MEKRTNWLAIGSAYALGVVGAAQVGRVAPAVETLRTDLELSLTSLGWAISLITLASAAFGVGMGVAAVKAGARLTLILGGTLLALTVAVSSAISSTEMLLAVRALEGVGYLAIVVAAPTLIASEAEKRDVTPALALWGTFFTLGISISAFAGSWMSDELGWRAWFGVNSGALIIATIAALLYTKEGSNSNQNSTTNNLTIASLPIASWLLGSAFFGLTVIALAILSMLPAFLIDARGFDQVSAGKTTGLIALSSLAGSLAFGILVKSWDTTRLILMPVVVLIITAVPAFLFSTSTMIGVTAAATGVFANGVLIAMVFSAVPRVVKDPRLIGPTNGLVAQLGSIGAVTGPPFVGYAVAAWGWLALSALIIICSVSFAILMLATERTNGRSVSC